MRREGRSGAGHQSQPNLIEFVGVKNADDGQFLNPRYIDNSGGSGTRVGRCEVLVRMEHCGVAYVHSNGLESCAKVDTDAWIVIIHVRVEHSGVAYVYSCEWSTAHWVRVYVAACEMVFAYAQR